MNKALIKEYMKLQKAINQVVPEIYACFAKALYELNWTPEEIEADCKTYGKKLAEELLKQEKDEEMANYDADHDYNPFKYYYTQDPVTPKEEESLGKGNKSEILLTDGSHIYIGSIAGVVVMVYKDKQGQTQVKSNGLVEDLTFTESGEIVTTNNPKYDNTDGVLYASERNRLNKKLEDKNNRLVQAINSVTSSFNTMSDITYLERTGKRLRVYFTISEFDHNGYDIQYSSWEGKSPRWTKDTDVKYLDVPSFYKLPVAGLIWEINVPGGGLQPSITVVSEQAPSVYASGGQVDIFRAFIMSSKGADVWRSDVTRVLGNKSTHGKVNYESLGVAAVGNYYAVTGNRMNEDTIREIIENVLQAKGDEITDTGILNQTTPNSNPPVSSQSGNNGSSAAPSNGTSGNTSGSGSGTGTKPGQEGIKGNGDSSGDVDKDDDAGQTAAASAAAPNYLVFGLIAAAVAAGFFFIILLKRRKEEDEQ